MSESVLTPDVLKVAIVMIGRAPCKGDESHDVAATLRCLTQEYERLTQPPQTGPDLSGLPSPADVLKNLPLPNSEDEDGDDARSD